MIQIIVKAASKRRNTITYKFSSMNKARNFISEFNLENKIIDIL